MRDTLFEQAYDDYVNAFDNRYGVLPLEDFLQTESADHLRLVVTGGDDIVIEQVDEWPGLTPREISDTYADALGSAAADFVVDVDEVAEALQSVPRRKWPEWVLNGIS